MIQENKHYDIFKGTSQRERYKEEILPSSVKIDGRSLADLLQFVSQYATLIKFYSVNSFSDDSMPENWGVFFNKNNLIILISISNYNISIKDDIFQEKLNKAHNTKDQRLRINILNQLITPILTIGESLDYIRKNVGRDALTSDLLFDIGNAIQGELRYNLSKLYSYKKTLLWNDEIEQRILNLRNHWGGNEISSLENDTIMTISNSELEEIKSIFQSFFFTIHHTIEKAKVLLESLMLDMKNNTPHIALYLSFLKLYEHVQNIQNELPQKHLDFYYREILRQKERDIQPDEVLVNIELAKGVENYYLNGNTVLDAGTITKGKKLYYNTSLPVSLTNTKILRIKTLFNSLDNRNHQKPNSKFVTGMYSNELARGKKGSFHLNNMSAFGEEQVLKSESEKTLKESEVGFLITSPILNLSSGKRSVKFELEFETDSYNDAKKLLQEISNRNEESLEETIYKAFSTGFHIQISQKEGVKTIKNYGFNLDDENKSLVFDFKLGIEEEAFCGLDPGVFYSPQCDDPFITVKLKHECSLFLYSLIDELKLKNIKIDTHSEKLSDYVIYNNLGELNPNKPFEIFGTIPQNNNYFILGHEEAFSKSIKELKLSFNWFSLPILTGGIEDYFKDYKNTDLNSHEKENILTNDYGLKSAILKGGNWIESKNVKDQSRLFAHKTIDGEKIEGEYSEKVNLVINPEELSNLDRDTPKPYVFNRNSNNGFIRFDLMCPNFGFGHNHYAKLLSETVLKNSTLKKKETPINLLKEPFSPLVSNMELEYRSSVEAVSYNSSQSTKNEIDFFHLTPFGYKELELKSSEHSVSLMTIDNAQGNLYLGMDSYPYRGELSLLFILDEDKILDRGNNDKVIKWHFLSNNNWTEFGENNVINDTTNGFINSGIIQLRIPKQINTNNTIVSEDLFWVKVSVFGEIASLGKVKSIAENGVHAIWDQAVESDHIENKLPKHSISKTVEAIPEIGNINHETPSFGGRKKETEHHFYTRLSERLRHKCRAITALDYEELILEEFPEVYKVKCFMAQHTLRDDYRSTENLIIPGSVRIAVVADSQLQLHKFRPKVSAQTLLNIEKYLLRYTSPFTQVLINNPFYEQIRVICKVIFNNYESDSFNELKLQDDIIGYLNPWMRSFSEEEEFGKSIFKSEVLAFIQNLDYIDFVTEFSMIKILDQEGDFSLYDTARDQEESGEIKPLYPWSILVSSRDHDITIITDQSYGGALPRGITNMKIGTDFIISN